MTKGKRFGWLGLALSAFLASIVVQFIAAFIMVLPTSFMVGFKAGMQVITDADTITQMTEEAMTGILPVTVLVTHILILITFALWYRFGCGKPSLKKINKKDIFNIKHIVAMVLIALGMNFLANYGMSLVYPIIPESIMESYESMMESAGFGESLLPTIAAVLIAPFGEELVFRGVTFYYARKAVSDMSNKTAAFWIANVIQAFLFGVFHLNIVQGTYAFVLGLVLGYLAYRFKSILPAILGHMIFNGFSSFAAEPVSELIPEGTASYAIVVVVALAVMVAGYFIAGKMPKEAAAENSAEIA